MRKTMTLLIGLAVFMGSQAQKTGKVTGSIQDGGQKTIGSATISLLRKKDSSVIKMNVADKTGKFEFENIADGKYLVGVTAVGHQKAYSDIFEINGSNTVSLNAIQLVPQSKSLGEVIVNSK